MYIFRVDFGSLYIHLICYMHKKTMELYQLKTFKMVAEEGHLTRAAKRLNASQPAVSAHIKMLEDELGISLFLRTPKGMVLTAGGQKLKKHADRALGIVDEMISEAGKLQGTLSGDLRIGLNSEPDFLRISELFSTMKIHHPNLNLHLLQSMTGEVLNKLEDGVLDAGFIYGENDSDGIFSLKLQQQRLVVAGPSDWQDKLSRAMPKDLGKFPWIMTPADCPFHTVASRLFKKYSIDPTQVALVDQESTIKTMVKAGVGLSLVLEQEVMESGEGEFAVWLEDDLSLALSIACLKRRQDEPLLHALFGVLGRIWQVVSV